MGKKMSLCVFVLMTSLCCSSCVALLAGAAAGGAAVAWVKGALQESVDYPLDRVFTAGKSGLEKLDLIIIEERKDKHDAVIHAEDADGQIIKVQITALTERASKISVRVGTFGDRSRSEGILNSIKKYL